MIGDGNWNLEEYKINGGTPNLGTERIRPASFEEFRNSIMGDRDNFILSNLDTALTEQKITQKEYNILHRVYTAVNFDFSQRLQEILDNTESNLSIDVELDNGESPKTKKTLQLGAYMGYAVLRKGDGKGSDELLEESAQNMAKYKSSKKCEESPLLSPSGKK